VLAFKTVHWTHPPFPHDSASLHLPDPFTRNSFAAFLRLLSRFPPVFQHFGCKKLSLNFKHQGISSIQPLPTVFMRSAFLSLWPCLNLCFPLTSGIHEALLLCETSLIGFFPLPLSLAIVYRKRSSLSIGFLNFFEKILVFLPTPAHMLSVGYLPGRAGQDKQAGNPSGTAALQL